MPRVNLTEKEEEALLLAGDGLTIPQIAEKLGGVHPNTVKARLKSVRRKLNVDRKSGLVIAARRYFGR